MAENAEKLPNDKDEDQEWTPDKDEDALNDDLANIVEPNRRACRHRSLPA